MRHRIARSHRRGLTAVAVLICLVVITLISGALLKLAVVHRDQVRSLERRMQAEWLAQAGLERARARLTGNPDYAGENWSIAAADLGPGGGSPDRGPAAVVAIAVDRPGGSADQRLIKVQADFPPDPPRRARHSLQMLVDLGSHKTGAAR